MKNTEKNARIALISVATWAIVLSAPAWAQTAPAPAAASAVDTPEQSDIVVTAQRRSERSVDVPIAIASQSAEQLRSSGINSTLNLQQVVPGVIVNRFGNFTAPAIRGISTRVVGPGADNNVATYVDGFYVANAVGINRGFSDVSQIDVLKGPQGTLFGRNATGGALLITTRSPEFTTKLEANFAVERFDGYSGDIFLTTPVTDTLAVSVTAAHSQSDGYLRNVATGFDFPSAPNKSDYLKGKMLWNASNAVEFLLTAETGRQNDGAATALAYYAHPNPVIPPTIITEPYQTSISKPQKLVNEWTGAYLKSTFKLGGTKLTSFTGYRHDKTDVDVDFDGTTLVRPSAGGVMTYRQETLSQELNLASEGDSAFKWVVGAYFYLNNYYVEQAIPSLAHYGTKTRAYAGFAEGTYEVVDDLFLTGGIRYSAESKKCLVATPASTTGPLALCTGGDPDRTDSSWTPRAVVRYQLAPSTNVYASFSRGFKSGNFNTGTAAGYVKPETVSAYEIGFKTSSRRVRFDASSFYYNYANIQYGSSCVTPGCPAATISQNAAKSRIYGAEAALSGSVTSRLTASASVSWLHARFQSFPGATAAAPTGPLPTDPNISVPGGQDWSDQPLIRSPDWSFNLSATYTQPTSIGDFALSGNVYWTDDYAPNTISLPCTTTACGAGLEPRLISEAHALVNGNLSWTSTNKNFTAALFVRNLFDQLYILQTDGSAIGDWRIYGEPRVAGIRLGLRY